MIGRDNADFAAQSLKMVLFESLGMVFYTPSVVIIVASLAISQIYSIKEWPDLEIWVWDHSRSFKMARFNRPCTTFYWSAIVNINVKNCSLYTS